MSDFCRCRRYELETEELRDEFGGERTSGKIIVWRLLPLPAGRSINSLDEVDKTTSGRRRINTDDMMMMNIVSLMFARAIGGRAIRFRYTEMPPLCSVYR